MEFDHWYLITGVGTLGEVWNTFNMEWQICVGMEYHLSKFDQLSDIIQTVLCWLKMLILS
jgi:hypothetical protein